MPDDRTDTERGWQNVLRLIRHQLTLVRRQPDEPPLSPVEQGEQAAFLPVAEAVAMMRRHVPGELRKRMGDTE
jgi:hypothetical protein